MEIPGFDVYSFPTKPQVLYAIRDFEFKIRDQSIKIALELILRQNCNISFIKHGSAKNPTFLIKNNAPGLFRAVGSSLSHVIRDFLFSQPTGDIFEGCVNSIADIGSVFPTLPLPPVDIVARIPVIHTRSLEYESKIGGRKKTDLAIFQLRPQNFGYVFATEKGVSELAKNLEKKIKAFSPK